MKKSLIFFSALLAACSSKVPSLTYSNQPILNMESDVAKLVETNLSANSAWIKNKSNNTINLGYDLFWYDKNGVTQPFSSTQEPLSRTMLLQPQQKANIDLMKASPESVNYRLYLRLK